MRFGRIGVSWAAIGCLLLVGGPAFAGVDRFVDDDGLDCFGAQYSSIATAVAQSNPGDTVYVCPGLYEEQVVIDKHLNLRGRPSGTRNPILRPTSLPQTMPSLLSGNPITAAILVQSEKARVENLIIDLSNAGVTGCSPILTGIYLRGSNALIRRSTITGVRVAGQPACETGVGIYIEAAQIGAEIDGTPIFMSSSVRLDRMILDEYQKAGVVVTGEQASASISRSEFTGDNGTGGVIQNGIEVSFGAQARLRKNELSGHRSPIAGRVAAGALVFTAERVSLRRMTIDNGDAGIFIFGDRAKVARNFLKGLGDGVVLLGNGNKARSNNIDNSSVSGVYVDGNLNLIAGGILLDMPVGFWIRAGESNAWRSFLTVGVAEPVREGGTRVLGPDDVEPFTTFCTSNAGCNDGNQCTTSTCNLGTGVCSHANLSNGTVCDDGDVCSTGDACQAGACVGAALPNGTACDDGLFCLQGETCQGGVCTGTPFGCDDLNPCTADLCDEVLNMCVNINLPAPTPCPDGNVCNGLETCAAGVCTPGVPVNCNDGSACTADTCDPLSGCLNTNISATCDDGDACTADGCNAVSGCTNTAINCDDGSACTTDGCDPGSGCTNTAIGCDDGDACTTDGCDPGSGCTTTPIACDDGLECTTDSCDPGTGCQATAVLAGTPCTGGTCTAGVCILTTTTSTTLPAPTTTSTTLPAPTTTSTTLPAPTTTSTTLPAPTTTSTTLPAPTTNSTTLPAPPTTSTTLPAPTTTSTTLPPPTTTSTTLPPPTTTSTTLPAPTTTSTTTSTTTTTL
jgi:nitrous oxidase accessory protein NosD